MKLAESKLTAQGQISVPAKVRQKLGLVPGSVIEWQEDGERVVVRRAGKVSSQDIHRALFPDGPPKHATQADLKKGIEQHIRERYRRKQ